VRWRGYVSLPPHRSTDDDGAGLNGDDTLSGRESRGQDPYRNAEHKPYDCQGDP